MPNRPELRRVLDEAYSEWMEAFLDHGIQAFDENGEFAEGHVADYLAKAVIEAFPILKHSKEEWAVRYVDKVTGEVRIEPVTSEHQAHALAKQEKENIFVDSVEVVTRTAEPFTSAEPEVPTLDTRHPEQ